jgi:hypothetical protein
VSAAPERIQCYDCGESYQYLGRQHHSGECPTCHSHCVSPAGKVRILTTVDVLTEETTSAVVVLAVDDSSRRYVYHFGNIEGEIQLLALRIDDHVLHSSNVATMPSPPAAISSAVEQYLPTGSMFHSSEG